MVPALRGLTGVLILLAALLGTKAAAADAPAAVILASTAPGYATGQLLAAARVDIPDGASTTFLLPTGQMLTIKGPYAGALAASQPMAGNRLKGLLGAGADRSEIGGTRSLQASGNGKRLVLDPAAGGVHCLAPGTGLALRRPADPAFDRVSLRAGGGRAAELSWPAGAETLAWPDGLPVDTAITVTSLRTGAERRLELKSVDPPNGSEAAHAAALALAGCAGQAAALLEDLRAATVPLDIYLTSDRGRYPTYRPGEPVELVLQTNQDAFVYCVVRDMHGRTVPLFPPQPALARVAGHTALHLPGAWLPLALRAGDSLKDGEIRCIASERDLAGELPQLAAAAGAAPLSPATIEALDTAMADPRQGRVVMAQLILRVEN